MEDDAEKMIESILSTTGAKPALGKDLEIMARIMKAKKVLAETSGLEPFPEIEIKPKTETVHVMPVGTETLNRLFGIKWEESQLYRVLNELDLLDERRVLVAGGCIVRHLMKTEIFKGDIDLFPKTEAGRDSILKEFADKGFKIKKTKFSHEFEFKIGMRKSKVQIINQPASNTDTLAKFDFEHVRVGIHKGNFYTTIGAPTAIAQKELHLRYVKDPKYSLIRALKYQRMGFSADKAIHKLVAMISDNITDTNAADYESKFLVEY